MELNVAELLFSLCEDQAVFAPDTDLIESGLLDSLAMVELFAALEDYGIELQPTQIDRTKLHTVAGIQSLVAEYAACDDTGVQ